MKRYLSLLTLALLLAMSGEICAQHHRHNPQLTVPKVTADTTSFEIPSDTAGIVAYSDTTSATSQTPVDGEDNSSVDEEYYRWEHDGWDEFGELFREKGALSAMTIVGLVFTFIIVISPFLLLAFIAWIIVRNRNRRYKLMEQAMMQGQPIPQELMTKPVETNDLLWRKAIRNIFLGIGLGVLFWFWGSNILAGLGWLLCFYGIGQAVICKTSKGPSETPEVKTPPDTSRRTEPEKAE